MKNVFLVLVLLLSGLYANSQKSVLKINPSIRLPKDSLESDRLISSLNKFLISAQSSTSENEWVYHPQSLQTALLLDEIVNVHLSKKENNKFFYKPVVMDISPLNGDQFIVQVSYVSITDDVPVIRATFELIAHKIENKYNFSSTLQRNTKHWKITAIDNYTFHHVERLNSSALKEYIRLCKFHDNHLGIKPKETHFYLVEDGFRPQEYFGLKYKLDYNARGFKMSYGVSQENKEIKVLKASSLYEFDPHDLWHNRLSLITSRRKVNRSVDEGIANLYGGTWGITWEQLFIAFVDELQVNKKTDWLKLRDERAIFKANGKKSNTDFMVNALIVQNIEKDLGFSAVMELLNAKEEVDYFTVLKKLTGITKNNYNKEVWKLVSQELKKVQDNA